MFTEEAAHELVRPTLVAVIRHEAKSAGCKMKAYANVAHRIGVSAAWVRRVVGRDRKAYIGLHHGVNVMALYRERFGSRAMRAVVRQVFEKPRGKPRLRFFASAKRSVVPCLDVGPADALAYIPEDFA